MKYLFLIPLLFMAGCSAARSTLNSDEIQYEQMKDHNKSKADSFGLIQEWVAKTYNNSKYVIQLSDGSTGTMVIKATVPLTTGFAKVMYDYTFTIKTKDNKMKLDYEIGTNEYGAYPPEDSMTELKNYYDSITASLIDYVNSNDVF